jgi:hypothetical protein
MTRTPKTAPELERYVLNELRRCAGCNAISAVTVAAVDAAGEADWDVTHIQVPGGRVPQACRDICATAVTQLRERFELVTEFETDEL